MPKVEPVPGERAQNGADTLFWNVSRAGNELRMLNPIGNTLRLLPQGKDQYFDVENGADWTFERDASGAVVRMIRGLGGGRLATQRVEQVGGTQ